MKKLFFSSILTAALLLFGVINASAQTWAYSLNVGAGGGGNSGTTQVFNITGHNTFFSNGITQETPTTRSQMIRLTGTAAEGPGTIGWEASNGKLSSNNTDRFLQLNSIPANSIIRAMAKGTTTAPDFTYTIVLPGGTVTFDGQSTTRTPAGAVGANANFTFEATIDVPQSGLLPIRGASTSAITTSTGGKSGTVYPDGPTNGAALQLIIDVDVTAYTGRITVNYNLSTNKVTITPAPSVKAVPNPVNFSAIGLQQQFTLTGQYLTTGSLTLTTNNAAYTFQSTGTQTRTVPITSSAIATGDQTIIVNATTSAPASGGKITITGGGLPVTGYIVDLNYLPPTISVSPSTLTFSSASPAQNINIDGVGLNADLQFAFTSTPSGAFSVTAGTARNGTAQPIEITSNFSAATGSVRIYGGGLASTAEKTVNFTHAAATLNLPASLSFSAVAGTKTFTLTGSNIIGTLNLNAPGYTVNPTSIDASLTGGVVNQLITVSTSGTSNGTLTITGGNLQSPTSRTVPLNFLAASLTANPSSLEFTSSAGSKQFTLTGVGLSPVGGALSISSSDGAYTYTTTPSTVTIDANGEISATVTVTKTAVTTGANITCTAGGKTAIVPCTAGPLPTYCETKLIAINPEKEVIYLTCQKLPTGKYEVKIEADKPLAGLGGSSMTVSSGNVLIGNGTTCSFSTDKKTMTLTLTTVVNSTTNPYLYTPLYVLFDNGGGGSYQQQYDNVILNTTVWGVCPEKQPVIDNCVALGTGPTSCIGTNVSFNVSATTHNDYASNAGVKLTQIIVYNGATVLKTIPVDAKTITNEPVGLSASNGLLDNTTYNLSVKVKDTKGNLSDACFLAPFTTQGADNAAPFMMRADKVSVGTNSAVYDVEGEDNVTVFSFTATKVSSSPSTPASAPQEFFVPSQPQPNGSMEITLTNLAPNTTYTFDITCSDGTNSSTSNGNASYKKVTITFTTAAEAGASICKGVNVKDAVNATPAYMLTFDYDIKTTGTGPYTVTAVFDYKIGTVSCSADLGGLGPQIGTPIPNLITIGGTARTTTYSSARAGYHRWTASASFPTLGAAADVSINLGAVWCGLYTSRNIPYTVGADCNNPPTIGGNPTLKSVTYNSATIQGLQATDEEDKVASPSPLCVTKYTVQATNYNGGLESAPITATGYANTPTGANGCTGGEIIIPGLEPNTTYIFTIRAVDNGQNGGLHSGNTKTVTVTTAIAPTVCGTLVSSVRVGGSAVAANSNDDARLNIETLGNGDIKITLLPGNAACDNDPTFRGSFLGINGGWNNITVGGVANGASTKLSKVSCSGNVFIIHPVTPITPGTDIMFNSAQLEYKTTTNPDLYPDLTFKYVYGTNCNHLPKIVVSETALAFDKTNTTRTFNVSGTNLTDNIDITVTPAGKFTVSQTSIAPSSGTVPSTQITVTCIDPTVSAGLVTVSGGGGNCLKEKVTLTNIPVYAVCGKSIFDLKSGGGNISSTDSAMVFVETINGNIVITLNCVNGNNPMFVSNGGNNNGIDYWGNPDILTIVGVADYNTRLGIPTITDGIVTIPLKSGQTIPLGTEIKFTDTPLLYKTNGGILTLTPRVTFSYSYGESCALPQVIATPATLNFTPTHYIDNFDITGLNLNPALGPLTVTAPDGFTVYPTTVPIESNGTVNPAYGNIVVTCGAAVSAGYTDYVLISGGGLGCRPVKVKLVATDFSEWCRRPIYQDYNSNAAVPGGKDNLALLTVYTSTDSTKVYFKIEPYGDDYFAYWNNGKIGTLNISGLTLKAGGTPTITSTEYYDGNSLAIVTFNGPVTGSLTFGGVALVWGIEKYEDSQSTGVGRITNAYINAGTAGWNPTYTIGKNCAVEEVIYPFDVRGLKGTQYSGYGKSGFEMKPIQGTGGTYSVAVKLPADTYEFLVYKDGKAPADASGYVIGAPRVFTLASETDVTFYARAVSAPSPAPAPQRAGGIIPNFDKWRFVCDAEDIYIVTYDNTSGAQLTDYLLPIKKADGQLLIRNFLARDCNLQVKDATSAFVKDDIADKIAGNKIGLRYSGYPGYFRVAFEYETFNVDIDYLFEDIEEEMPWANNGVTPYYSDAYSYDDEMFVGTSQTDFGTFDKDNHLKIGGIMSLWFENDSPLKDVITVKMHYQIDGGDWKEFELPFDRLDEDGDLTVWEMTEDLWDVFTGINLLQGEHTIKMKFTVWVFGDEEAYTTDDYDAIFHTNGNIFLSLDEILKDKFIVYPNPVKDVLHIYGLNGAKDVKILDITGKTIVNLKSSIVNTIDVSSLASGVYLINIDNQFVKFVKK